MATHRFSYIFELECDPPCYLWTGHGQLDIGPKTYLGAGHLISLPDVKQLINGVAERLEISVSGVSQEALRLFLEDRESVYLASAKIGRVNFDDNWQIDGDIEWQWQGFADLISIKSSPNESGRTRSITIGLGNEDTRRSNPNISFFTDADQRKRSADDAFFSHVGQINAGVTRRFGPK